MGIGGKGRRGGGVIAGRGIDNVCGWVGRCCLFASSGLGPNQQEGWVGKCRNWLRDRRIAGWGGELSLNCARLKGRARQQERWGGGDKAGPGARGGIAF